jgi:hypothetical protein
MRTCRSLPALAAVIWLTGCSSGQTKLRTASMGERIELGHIIYTVFDTQWLTQIGEGVDAKVPQNRYFLIRLSAANSLNAPVIIPPTILQDDEGKTYNELSDGQFVPQWIGFLREVKTAEAAQGNIAFDVLPRHYKLRIADENNQSAVLVDIPLSLGTDLPVSPLPESEPKK